jgi:two-component system NtrC family sensor kinase
VDTASSGRDALARMTAESYDVVLTDIRMPDMDGRALYHEIERRWPGQGARVVFVTGDTLTTASRDFVAECGRPVIEKPFLPSEVRRVVAELAGEVQRAPER